MRWSVNLVREDSQWTIASEIGFIRERGERRERENRGSGNSESCLHLAELCVCWGKEVLNRLVSC